MICRERDFQHRTRGGLEYLDRLLSSRLHDPQPVYREAERLAEDGEINLQAIVALECASGAEAQARLGRTRGKDTIHLADRSAPMADGIAIGDFLIAVGLHEQPRPWAAEDGLQ